MFTFTRNEIQLFSPESFRERMESLWHKFEAIQKEATLVAKEIQKMEECCSHRNLVETPAGGKWCADCKQYPRSFINTSFSPEVNAWFKEQNKLSIEEHPMVVMPPPL